jgi:hypothetical protein
MVLVDAEKPQLFGRGIQISFGVLFGIFGLFERALGDRALVVKNLRALQLHPRQPLVIHGLLISLVSAGDIVALHFSSNCPFFTRRPAWP